ncbi:DNA-directed RNA polymerase subunit delta [Bacillus massiliigorillae]|uniref:DNA-directed RNA polymerase subunit delta n=1 Tax=Bacillus massiliigorillae TaxID=1243664 RepID=UPI0003AB049D|nr:DNA-directed RNA polymerase subunit delta [Bacillus massiliigorillae]
MSLNQYTKEELKEMSLIEVAYEILSERKQAVSFQELVSEIAKLQDKSMAEINMQISQFYTDLNVDGRFSTTGENHWGLKDWYPVDQVEDELTNSVKPKKKKAKKVADDELDEFEELDEDGFDEEEDEEDEDDLDVLDTDLDDDLEDDDDDLVEDDDDFELDEDDEDEDEDEL